MAPCPKIYTLSSGSSGNCVFVSSGSTSILVDVGISERATQKLLCEIGSSLDSIDAIFITHEHTDHIKGLEVILKHRNIPVYLPLGCLDFLPCGIDRSGLHGMDNSGFSMSVGDIGVEAFKTPHDSAASVGYTFTIGERKFGVATDMGYVTSQVAEALCGCEKIIIEANYEKSMLENGPYSKFLKERIVSSKGHLENSECAKIIAYLSLEGGADTFLLAHLSEQNNSPSCALETIGRYLKDHQINARLLVASRNSPSLLVNT